MNKRVWVIALILVFGAAYAMAYQAARPKGTPQGQIRETLLDAVDALHNGQTGRAMGAISPAYKDSTGANRDRLWLLARQAAQNRDYWDAVVEDMNTRVLDDEATVQVRVSVHRTEGGGVTRHTIDLRMRREKAHAFLVVPTSRWRIVSAVNLPTEETAFGF